MSARRPPLPQWAESIHEALPEEGSAKVLIPGAEGVRYVELSRQDLEESVDQESLRRARRRRRVRSVLAHHHTRRLAAAVGMTCMLFMLAFGSVGLFHQQRSTAHELAERESNIQSLDGAFRAYLDVTRHLLSEDNVTLLATMEDVGLDADAVYAEASNGGGLGSGDEGGRSPVLHSLLERIDTEHEDLLLQNMKLNTVVSMLPSYKPLAEMSRRSDFGLRRHPLTGRLQHHAGVDFVTSGDPTIRASQQGVVTLAERNGGYGLSVEVTGITGVVTRYAHLRSMSAEVGDEVRPGDPIGIMGSTGASTGPHLHYEVLVDGEAVDPLRVLELTNYGMD